MPGDGQRRPPRTTLQALLRFGGGLVDDAADLVEALAMRGEELERRQRALLGRRMDRLGRGLARLRDRVLDELEELSQGAWHALRVPTRSDIEELTRSVERLTREVERLTED